MFEAKHGVIDLLGGVFDERGRAFKDSTSDSTSAVVGTENDGGDHVTDPWNGAKAGFLEAS